MAAADANTLLQVTVALSDQILQWHKEALRLEAVSHGLQQVSTTLTAETRELEGQVHDLTHDVQSTEIEMSGLRSRINDLQSINAGLKKESVAFKSRNQIVCSTTPLSDHSSKR